MKMFDKNKDGRLDLNDLARYCSNCFTFWHLRVFFAATPAVLFHGGDTGEGVRMGNREGHTT